MWLSYVHVGSVEAPSECYFIAIGRYCRFSAEATHVRFAFPQTAQSIASNTKTAPFYARELPPEPLPPNHGCLNSQSRRRRAFASHPAIPCYLLLPSPSMTPGMRGDTHNPRKLVFSPFPFRPKAPRPHPFSETPASRWQPCAGGAHPAHPRHRVSCRRSIRQRLLRTF